MYESSTAASMSTAPQEDTPGTHGPRIDHIIIACKDCRAAAKHIEEVYGLAAYEGGRHQGWGTENWLVPLGEAYLELAAVFDEEVADSCDWGRLITAKVKEAGTKPWILVTFAVETPEGAKASSERLNQDTAPMLRIKPGGQHLTWRVAAMSKFGADRAPKPFFITWDDPSMRPDKTPVQHRVQPSGISWVDLSGDKQAMSDWLGQDAAAQLPLRWLEGPPGINAVGIATSQGDLRMTSP